MGNEALATESVLCLLEMVGRKCGHVWQPGMQCMGGGWGGAKQGTKNSGVGTRQDKVQGNDED